MFNKIEVQVSNRKPQSPKPEESDATQRARTPSVYTESEKTEMETEGASASGEYLVAALEQATVMAKQLPNTKNPYQINHIYNTLHSAHRHLSVFLSQHHPFLPTSLPPENSVSSTLGARRHENGDTGGEPMQMGDEDEQDSKATSSTAVDKVEERMRECFIQNKRPKRSLSPSAAGTERQQRQSYENRDVTGGAVAATLDPYGTKLRSLDLVYQFHG